MGEGNNFNMVHQRFEILHCLILPFDASCHPTIGSRNQKQLGGALHTVTEGKLRKRFCNTQEAF